MDARLRSVGFKSSDRGRHKSTLWHLDGYWEGTCFPIAVSLLLPTDTLPCKATSAEQASKCSSPWQGQAASHWGSAWPQTTCGSAPLCLLCLWVLSELRHLGGILLLPSGHPHPAQRCPSPASPSCLPWEFALQQGVWARPVGVARRLTQASPCH